MSRTTPRSYPMENQYIPHIIHLGSSWVCTMKSFWEWTLGHPVDNKGDMANTAPTQGRCLCRRLRWTSGAACPTRSSSGTRHRPRPPCSLLARLEAPVLYCLQCVDVGWNSSSRTPQTARIRSLTSDEEVTKRGLGVQAPFELPETYTPKTRAQPQFSSWGNFKSNFKITEQSYFAMRDQRYWENVSFIWRAYLRYQPAPTTTACTDFATYYI